ncbi:SANT/Myb_domain [Hexamita inflata]|uniref:SANT/Myb domain n=1 Tax=Hexamita inflata TaxID=28002 RepID=A0AA86NYY5_9EUKA|nr:SANT/Myb domain [Hexamita inflata]
MNELFAMCRLSERSRWSFREDKLLYQRVLLFGASNYKLLALEFEGKTEKQIYFRIRYLKSIYIQKKNVDKVRNMYKEWFAYFEQ